MFRTMLVRLLVALALTLGVSTAAPVTVLLPGIQDFKIVGDSIQPSMTTKGSPIAYRVVLFTPKSRQCITDALETPGQAWTVHLSAGGVSLLAANKVANGSAVIPQSRGTALLSTLTGTESVNVLVIDKFRPIVVLMQEHKQPLLALHLSHGALVTAHLGAVLEGAGFRWSGKTSDKYGKANVYTKGSQVVRLLPIDLDAFNTGPQPKTGKVLQTTESLAKKLDDYIKADRSIKNAHLIINMSFAILPCELQTHYFQLRDQMYALKPPVRLPFRVYLEAVAILNGQASNPDAYIESIIAPPKFSDPLRDWITQQQTTWNNRFAAVAASGNYELPFQTMPAAWPEVLGVGATTVKPLTSPSTWSDRGDVLEVGEWFSFRGAHNASSNTPSTGQSLAGIVTATSASGNVNVDQNNFAYLGTSFAAPTVTAALAVAMGKPTSACFKGKTFIFSPLVKKSGNLSFLTSFQNC